MATKFAQYLQENQIDPRRLLVASKRVERLRPEDRRLKLQKRQAKGKGGDAPAPEAGAAKRRSGRPVTQRLIDNATVGKPISGPAKTRLLRAVNRVLEQKQKSAADLKTLF